jgi:adenylate cyclase
MARGDYQRSAPVVPAGRARVERRLAAILGADIMGYSAMMARAEEETHDRVGAELDHVFREIEKSHGRVFTFAGDGLMAEFPSAVEALKCALRIQAHMARRNARLPADHRILFRIGINSGEIVLQKNRTGGNAVNIAARLEAIAEPGGIALSEAVYEQVRHVVSAGYAYFGEQKLKNIRDFVAVHTIPPEECSAWAGMPALPRLSPQAGGFAGMVAGGPEYRASLAVLPFRTLQRDQSDAYFAEGIVDDIIRALGGLKDMLVIARSSTQTFARAPLDLRRVGHELDVRYVLHGSVRRARDSLRIAVELCEAATGSIIWVDRFDGGLEDLFDLQDRISVRVATSVAPHLRERELTHALRKHPDSMTAYDLTLQALDLFHRADRASLERAGGLLGQAIESDPNYGPAHSHMAALLQRIIGQGWSSDEAADSVTAADHARAAIDRDRNDAVALAVYGHVQGYLLKHYEVATQYLDQAMEVGPSCPLAWGYSSLTCGYLREYRSAVTRAEQALRLSPIGPDSNRFEHYLSQAYYLDDRYDQAVSWARASASHAPVYTSNLRCLIASLVAVGDVDEARAVGQELMRLVPTFRLSPYRIRTPLPPEVADRFVERLRRAGLPE